MRVDKKILELVRWKNVLISMFVGLVAVRCVAPGNTFSFWTFLFMLMLGLLNIFANVHNDIEDMERDRTGGKPRPLAMQQVDIDIAQKIAYGSLGIALLISILLGFKVFVLVLFLTGMIYLYNKYLKIQPLWGNIAVAFITMLVFLIPGVKFNVFRLGLISGMIAFYYNFMREILKDWADIEYDFKAGITTLPMILGDKLTNLILIVLSAFFIPFMFLPFIAGVFGKWYVYIGISFGAMPFFVSLIALKKTPENLKLLVELSKYLMIPILLGMYLGV